MAWAREAGSAPDPAEVERILDGGTPLMEEHVIGLAPALGVPLPPV